MTATATDLALRAGPPVSSLDASVYVHYPYCASICPYCDFNRTSVTPDGTRYADAVLAELAHRATTLAVPTAGLASVYFGGGTPSLWDPREIGRILAAIEARFGFRPKSEITVECNPDDVTRSRLTNLVAAGVNRFSLGVQSLRDRELRGLGRRHDADVARRAVRQACATGARVSLDLIYGLPEQSRAAALSSVDAALHLEPDHISAYPLTVEAGTPLARQTRLGTFRPMPDDAQADLIEAVSARLEGAGYRRYEVSSYARSGRVSVHNTGYWVGTAYLGLGAGAHGYLPSDGGARRYGNVRPPERYMRAALRGRPESEFEEQRDRAGQVEDRALVALRTAFGLDPRAWATEFGPEWDNDTFVLGLHRLEARDWLQRAGGRWRPTPRGFQFNDALARELVDLAGRCAVPRSPQD